MAAVRLMARPPLDPGTYGKIRVRQVGPGTWEARCQYRQRNGAMKHPRARGPSATAAERALKKRLTEWTDSAKRGVITRDTKFHLVIDLYLEDLEHKVEQDSRSHNTLKTYRSYAKLLKRHLGELRMRELEEAVDVVDEMVKTVQVEMSLESAKKIRSLTSAIVAFGIRRGAKIVNPVREIETLVGGPRAEIKAMTLAQIAEMLRGLVLYGQKKAAETTKRGRYAGKRGAVWTDLGELAAISLALAQRLGEGLSLAGIDVLADEIDEEGRLPVRLDSHIVRIRGQGLRRVPGRKSHQPAITVRAPAWATPILLRRKEAAGDSGPLFPAMDGGWLDQDNTNKRLREALDAIGFQWVSAKVWRSTAATLLGRSGLSAEDVAAHLGNTRAVAERHYVRPRRIAEKGALVLEQITFLGSSEADHDHKVTNEGVTVEWESDNVQVRVGAAGIEPATARR